MQQSQQQLQIPVVTMHDLSTFHHTHLCQRPDRSVCASLCYAYQEEDDGLGHYADGTKRTLTDSQIDMFRFSEIQELLKQKRRRLALRKRRHSSLDDDDGEDATAPHAAVVVAPEEARRNRLEAALWAAKHDWDEFGNPVDVPSPPREYVAEVQGDADSGKTFLWPKIQTETDAAEPMDGWVNE